MKREDRDAIIARYAKHSTVEDGCFFDEDDKTWKPIPELRAADLKANQTATVADELRTEGHARTRRPLSNPHESL